MTERAVANETIGRDEPLGKHLTFRLGAELYGVAILSVREIIALMDITPVPRTPESMRGVINLRGKIIPVIDLRLKFGMSATEETELTCIVVVDLPCGGQTIQMGVLVDSVEEVLDIDAEHLEEMPRFGSEVDTDFIRGVGKIEDKVVMLLDVRRILDTGELDAVAQAGAEGAEAAELTEAA